MNELALENTFTTEAIPTFFRVAYSIGAFTDKFSKIEEESKKIEEEAKELEIELDKTLDDSIVFFSDAIDKLVHLEKARAIELYTIVKDTTETTLRVDNELLRENIMDNFLSGETIDKLKRSNELIDRALNILKIIATDDVDDNTPEFENFLVEVAHNAMNEGAIEEE